MRIPIMTQAEMNSYLIELRAGTKFKPKVDFTGADIATLDKQIDDFLDGLLASIETAGGSLAEPGKERCSGTLRKMRLKSPCNSSMVCLMNANLSQDFGPI